MKRELEEVEEEIESLLQRQSKLFDRKDELEAILKQSTSKAAEKNEQWEKTGLILEHWLILLHSERPKLYGVLAVLSVKGLKVRV